MKKIELAKSILKEKDCTCVAIMRDDVKISYERGIRPILQWLNQDEKSMMGAFVCDKVVGKAAALLFAYGKIKAIHTLVISGVALKVFEENNIEVTYDKLVERIKNRDNTDLCPMETKAIDINSPREAYNIFSNLTLENGG